jgi:hypothetical protein
MGTYIYDLEVDFYLVIFENLKYHLQYNALLFEPAFMESVSQNNNDLSCYIN